MQYRHDPDVQPPYTYNQITETARHREILQIYQSASVETRILYDQGQFFEGPNEENWIIRWCLYHSFRYTDNRNRTRSRGRKLLASTSHSSEDGDGEDRSVVNGMSGMKRHGEQGLQGQPGHQGPSDGNWARPRVPGGQEQQRTRPPNANNLRPRYGLPAGGFDTGRRPSQVYEGFGGQTSPESSPRDVFRESSEFTPSNRSRKPESAADSPLTLH